MNGGEEVFGVDQGIISYGNQFIACDGYRDNLDIQRAFSESSDVYLISGLFRFDSGITFIDAKRKLTAIIGTKIFCN